MRRLGLTAVVVATVVAACSGPILANSPVPQAVLPTSSPTAAVPADPQPIVFPRDDGPHDRLTEWWYYTGHLRDDAGGRWGFEFVIFRAERGGFPVTWASHLAVTDEVAGTFQYDQRSEIGPQVAGPLIWPLTRNLGVRGEAGPTPWSMIGGTGLGEITASFTPTGGDSPGTPIGLGLAMSPLTPRTLHDTDGWVDFGAAGGSYYYSQTRLAVLGQLTMGGRARTVEGMAWFDHQWGDFISVGGGGWDWFAVNLDDGTDLMISIVRAADGTTQLAYGTLIDATGRARNLVRGAFEVAEDPEATWISPATGATYPAGWTIRIPAEGLVVRLAPTVADQELDTRATTGVVYWEGSQIVSATRDGVPLGGEAYVELTGYASPTP